VSRIGVFICHCGHNIERTVSTEQVTQALSSYPNVAYAMHYDYMCSDPGQRLITDAIDQQRLDGIVVAACSPSMHEMTFRRAAEDAGMNPYLCEMANIREQCSWVHEDRTKATEKATRLVKMQVEKVRRNLPLEPISIDHAEKCLVIGGGIAGIQAALDVAEAGYEVLLVEKQPSIGGHMAQLSETFPTLDCSQCILTPKMVEVSRHPNIRLLTYSEVEQVSGYVGNFQVRIRKNPTYVDPDACNLCGECVKVCPRSTESEFECGLVQRKAIYIPFQQAIPSSYTLDEEVCLGLNPLRCDECSKVCDVNAINYDMVPEYIDEQVGAVIVATGYELYSPTRLPEYGGGLLPDVIDGLQFERLLSASGPTSGEVRRPSDGSVPKHVVFIQCAGSRDPEHHNAYCSKICCMYTAKHALLYRHAVPEGQATVFYIDIRAGGKGYEEFIQSAIDHERILYLRGKVARLYQDRDHIVVCGVDTLSGKAVEINADLVVLATSMDPHPSSTALSKTLKISCGAEGFLKEAHPKLRPVDSLTAGIYLAGAGQAPKDIPEAVAQGSGAASKAIGLLAQKELIHSPEVVSIDEAICGGCGICVSMCPYEALSVNGAGVAEVNQVLCEGCGTCVSACPSGAAQLLNLTDHQLFEMIEVALAYD
jgi:heterodisulfide reductase subunit A